MPNELIIPEAQEREISTQVSGILARANEVVILTAEDEVIATDELKAVAVIAKNIESAKKSITDPANATLKAARSFFAPFEEQAEKAKNVIKNKILAFKLAQQKAAEAREAEITKKLESGKIKPATAERKLDEVQRPQSVVTGQSGGQTQIAKVKKVVIFDESLIPRNYLIPNVPQINADAKAGFQIPGVRVDIVDQLSIR